MTTTNWVPEDEYKRITDSWKGQPARAGRFDFGTARENFERCHANVVAKAKELAELEALRDRLPPGDIRLVGGKRHGIGRDGEPVVEDVPPLRLHLQRVAAELKHWRWYLEEYRADAAGEPLAPPVRLPTDPIPPDPRLPREVGADDDEPREFVTT